jgi:hypothetical protein
MAVVALLWRWWWRVNGLRLRLRNGLREVLSLGREEEVEGSLCRIFA